MAAIPKDYYKYGLLAGLGIAGLVEYDNLDILYNTLGRDLQSVYRYGRILREYRKQQRQNKTIPDYFYETVTKFGDKVSNIFGPIVSKEALLMGLQ